MLLEKAMASETPPNLPPEGSYALPDEYEFEPDDDLAPGNELLDEVLTRAGEFALDTIEAIQDHPILAGAIAAATFGALAGLVAAAVVPRRRPAPPPPPTVTAAGAAGLATAVAARAAEAASSVRLSRRLSDAQEAVGSRLSGVPDRFGGVAGTAGRRAQDAGVLGEAALATLAALSARAARRTRHTAEDLASTVTDDVRPGVGSAVAHGGERAKYAAQLVPIGLALLRNAIVRDLLANAIAGRLRKTGRF
jgi:hypothetical protein